MMRTKAQKAELVTSLASRLKRSPTIYVTDFTGLDVAQITQLRRKLRAAGAEYAVVKNTLVRRALAAAQVTGIDGHLDGPTALVLGGADPVASAKVLADFAKEHEKPAIKAGLVEGKTVSPAEVKHLAALPSKPELLAQLAGSLQGPLAGFVGMLNGLMWNMLGALEALHTKRASGAAQ
jgi:large subunit ribosomal protein L10